MMTLLLSFLSFLCALPCLFLCCISPPCSLGWIFFVGLLYKCAAGVASLNNCHNIVHLRFCGDKEFFYKKMIDLRTGGNLTNTNF